MKLVSALVIVHPGMEELECIAPVDLLRRAGVQVTLAACGDADATHPIVGKNGITLLAETTLGALPSDSVFDLVVIPGGPGVQALRKRPEPVALLQNQAHRSGWIACICAAPVLLKDAGLLKGRRYTAHPAVAAELPDALGEDVVLDGKIITSRGAGTAIAFGLALISVLLGSEKAREIAGSICFSGKIPA